MIRIHMTRVAGLTLPLTLFLTFSPTLGWSSMCAFAAGPPPAESAVSLPAPRRDGAISVEKALATRRSIRSFRSEPLALAALSQLLWAAQGISGTEGRRTAPSAGATYPLDVYVVAGQVDSLKAGIYRYRPDTHDLMALRTGDRRQDLATAAREQSWLADAPAALVITGTYSRTTWKYRERDSRYVQIESGHAAENVALQAVALGLGTTLVGAFDDAEVRRVVGAPDEALPLCILPVGRADEAGE